MVKKFNFQNQQVTSAKAIYNKSHGGFKKVNPVAKKIDKSASFLKKTSECIKCYCCYT